MSFLVAVGIGGFGVLAVAVVLLVVLRSGAPDGPGGSMTELPEGPRILVKDGPRWLAIDPEKHDIREWKLREAKTLDEVLAGPAILLDNDLVSRKGLYFRTALPPSAENGLYAPDGAVVFYTHHRPYDEELKKHDGFWLKDLRSGKETLLHPFPGSYDVTRDPPRIFLGTPQGVATFTPDRTGKLIFSKGEASYLDLERSPDGKRLAFVVAGAGDADGVWLVGIDGDDPRQLLTAKDGGVSQPRWSPDGQRIACIVGVEPRANRTANLAVVNVDGSGLAKLLDVDALGAKGSLTFTSVLSGVKPEGVARLAWSPDGRRIAFLAGLERGARRMLNEGGATGTSYDPYLVTVADRKLVRLMKRPWRFMDGGALEIRFVK